jgi:hypothetical protein
MSVSVNYTSKILTTEVLETNVPAANDKSLQHNGYDTVEARTAASSPPVSKCAFFEKALAAGVATIDLTALVGSNGAAVDGSGLRVQFVKFRNKAANGNVMTLSKGAANGYDGLGASFSVTIPPGGEVLVRAQDGGTDIGGTNKTLDLAGTLTQIAEMAIVLG